MKAINSRVSTPARILAIFLSILAAGLISANLSRQPRSSTSNEIAPSASSPRDNSAGNLRSEPAARARVHRAYGKLPMRFEANEGQTGQEARFIARGAGYSLFLTPGEAVLRLRKPGKERENETDDQSVESAVVRMRLAGANRKPGIAGVERLQTRSNYFIGNDRSKWRTNVANFAKVKYESVYPGVDLVWHGNQERIEHDFIVAPGADPGLIKLSFTGAGAMKVDDEGALVLLVGGEELRLLKPVAWQEADGVRNEVECRYEIGQSNRVAFRLGNYDHDRELVIDPVLAYSTYIGGTGVDQANDIAVDNDGFAYITGQTDSADFPGPSPIQSAKGAQTDVFVLKINQAGNAVVYGAWLGGQSTEAGNEIVVDGSGAAFIAGVTASDDFPTKNAPQPIRKGGSDAFVAKLNSAGNDLVYSTYLGGSNSDTATGLALDASGNAYLTGGTDSFDFPLVGAFQTGKKGSAVYSTTNAGSSWNESGAGMSVSQVNDIAIDPKTPTTIYAGTERGLFKSDDGGASWSRIGGDQFIFSITQIAIDPVTTTTIYALAGSAIYKSIDGGATWNRIMPVLSVQTLAIDPATPATLFAAAVTGQPFKSVDGGANWTPFNIRNIPGGGPINALIRSFAIDPANSSIVYAGGTGGVYKSTDGGTTWNPVGNGLSIGGSAVVVRLAIGHSDSATLYAFVNGGGLYKTTNGGASWSIVNLPTPIFTQIALAIDPSDADIVYLGTQNFGVYKTADGGATWNTANSGLNGNNIRAIAIHPGAPTTVYIGTNSGADLFVAKLNPAGTALIYSSYLGGSGSDSAGGIAVDSSGAAYVAGTTQSQNFPTVSPYQSSLKGISDGFVAKINAAGAAVAWSTFLGGDGSENANDIAIGPADSVIVAGVTASTDFPTAKAFQAQNKSVSPATSDAFIARFSSDGSKLESSTYLGGAGFDAANGVALDGAGNVYVTGYTDSADFPALYASQPNRSGDPQFSNLDAFAAKIAADGSSLLYSTYLGGNGFDQAGSIALDGMGAAYVTGFTTSPDFPITPNPLRGAGPSDSFVTKLALSADLAISIGDLPDPVMVNNQLVYTLTVTNNGPDPASDITITDTLPNGVEIVSVNTTLGTCGEATPVTCGVSSLAPGAKATITITVKPTAAGMIANSASVTSATNDLNAANNSATQETKVSTLPSIFGRVTTGDGEGLSGVTVNLTGAQRPPAVTPDDGAFQFAELQPGGDFTVTPSRQGYAFNPPTRGFNNLTSDQRADFTAVACLFAIAPRNQSFPTSGGAGAVTVTSPDPQCPWSARSEVPWIKITSAANGNGDGMVTFSVEPTVGSRAGALIVAGNVFTVRQEFNPCGAPDFPSPQLIPLTGSFFDRVFPRVVVRDFNGDGRPDPAYLLSFDRSGVAVSLSNAGGGYDQPNTLITGADYGSLHSADLNGDMKPDLIATRGDASHGDAGGDVLVWLNNGAGVFNSPTEIKISPVPAWAAINDFNNDGKADLAVAAAGPPTQSSPTGQNVIVLLGDGTGGLGAPASVSLPLPNNERLQVETADFNGDGKPDLAALNGVGDLVIMQGAGNGAFENFKQYHVGVVFCWMAAGDFNGDGKTDIAVINSSSNGLRIFLNDGAGGLGQPVITNMPFVPSSIGADDFDGDGKTDVAVTYSDGFAVFHASANGFFAEPARYALGVTLSGFDAHNLSPLATGDYNRDGRADLFVPVFDNASANGYSVSLAMVNTTGNGFAAPRNFAYAPAGTSSNIFDVSAEAADLNGDGVLDLAVAAANNIFVALGDGRGEFGAPQAYFAGQTPQSLALRDFNNDGKLDALVRTAASDAVTLLTGDGNGGFQPRREFDVGGNPRSLGVGDFNGDGKQDFIAKSVTSGLGLYAGDGAGNFTETVSGLAAEIPDPVFIVGDFNGDAYLDLAVTAFNNFQCGNNSTVITLSGDGAGGFTRSATTNFTAPVNYLTTSDINGDGRADLLFTNACANTKGLYIALANAAGGFADPVKYAAGDEPYAITVGDLNGDGRPDLVVTTPKGGSIFGDASILIGKGDGSFNAATPLTTGRTPAVILARDFNEDGAADLAVIRGANASFSLRLNRANCPPPNGVVPVNAAGYGLYRLGGESIAATFGVNLASTTQAATALPLPTTLANTSVKIKDSAGVERLAPLFFVSPGQINHLIPAGTAPGAALITVTSGASDVAVGTALITAISPGLFSADSSGQGLAAAVVLRVKSDGSQVFEPVVIFDPAQNKFVAVPIDLSDEAEQVFLILFGTGIRNNSDSSAVSVKIGGEDVAALYAGSQGGFEGLDQINLPLPQSLRGRGEADVVVTVNGRAANAVRINIK